MAPNTDSARVLAFPAGYLIAIKARAVGIWAAAPIPWRALEMQSMTGDFENPFTRDHRPNQNNPDKNTLR